MITSPLFLASILMCYILWNSFAIVLAFFNKNNLFSQFLLRVSLLQSIELTVRTKFILFRSKISLSLFYFWKIWLIRVYGLCCYTEKPYFIWNSVFENWNFSKIQHWIIFSFCNKFMGKGLTTLNLGVCLFIIIYKSHCYIIYFLLYLFYERIDK